MSVISMLAMALAIGIADMLLLYRHNKTADMRPSQSLLATLTVAVIHTGLYLLGVIVGQLVRFSSANGADLYAKENALLLAVLGAFVALRQLRPYLRRKKNKTAIDPAVNHPVIMMAMATGINILLLGLGVGCADGNRHSLHIVVWPLLGLTILLGHFGAMMGRQHTNLRQKRWIALSSLMIVAAIAATAVNAA
ncbi:MAG: manganese efflux pump [Bacteroidales bacterium]|nr:manganese efflux pump [Bacteroidales bacterium]